jgi:glutaredoxin 3
MVNIVMYASAYCPYCRAARALLDDKGVQYTIMDVDSDYSLWEEMAERSHRDTVPQIFIDALHVGGFDDLSALDARGGLDPLLNKR